ncbi:hypothetical protein GCM10023201_15010 [Actinomycetospora corticicola]
MRRQTFAVTLNRPIFENRTRSGGPHAREDCETMLLRRTPRRTLAGTTRAPVWYVARASVCCGADRGQLHVRPHPSANTGTGTSRLFQLHSGALLYDRGSDNRTDSRAFDDCLGGGCSCCVGRELEHD